MSAAETRPVALRDYQADAIDRVRACMASGKRRVVLVVPTGGGKTVIAAEIVRRAVERVRPDGSPGRVLWLAHRTELVGQACRTLFSLRLEVGAVAASSEWPARSGAPVQVCSIQTLIARTGSRPPADLIVWDEAHHASEAAAEWATVLDAYPGVRAVGLTATPERADGTGLAPLFDGLVVGVTTRKLTELGHLVPCEVIRPAKYLKGRAPGNPLAQDPVEAYLEHGRGKDGAMQQGFLFARSVEEAQEYAAKLTACGVRAECVHAGTHPDDRADAIDLFRAGTVRVLCNVYVFTEGTDLPTAAVCVLARGASTAGTFLQMVGRVLRPAPGKSSATLIDLQGVSHLWGMPEDERVFTIDGRGIAKAGALCPVCSTPLAAYPCSNCGYMPAGDDDERAGTEITGDKLAKFARKIAEGPEQRRQTFDRWLAAARIKGHKPRSVGYKWKAVYGTPVEQEPWWIGWS